MNKKHPYRVEDELADTTCGFDYKSFLWGWDCPASPTKVIIEDDDFHFAHLCEEHTTRTMQGLESMDLISHA